MTLLADFFAKGMLGAVKLGDSFEQVTSLLGEGDQLTSSRKNGTRSTRHGPVILSFHRQTTGFYLSLITLRSDTGVFELPNDLSIDDWKPREILTLKGLFERGIACQELNSSSKLTNVRHFRVSPSGSVSILVEDGLEKMVGLSVSTQNTERQVTITLTEDSYESIRHIALQKHISVSKLCSLLVERGLEADDHNA